MAEQKLGDAAAERHSLAPRLSIEDMELRLLDEEPADASPAESARSRLAANGDAAGSGMIAADAASDSGGGPRGIASHLLRHAVQVPAQAVLAGYGAGVSGLYDTLANATMLLNRANDGLVRMTGLGTPTDQTVYPAVERWLREAARRVAPDPETIPDGVVAKIYAGLGRAPVDVATYLTAGRLLGPIAGMAGVEALREADNGSEAAATAAAKGALLGGTVKAIEPLSAPARAAAAGSIGAAQAVAGGGAPSDAVAGAATMGALGAALPRAALREDGALPATRLSETELRAFANTRPPGPLTAELIKGRNAASDVLDTQQSQRAAMRRDDVGDITFDYGVTGDPNRQYKGGWGLSHIAAKRTATDRIDGDAFVRDRLPEILTFGRLERIMGPTNGRRASIVLGDDTVWLSLSRLKDRETWVVTGYGKRPGASPR